MAQTVITLTHDENATDMGELVQVSDTGNLLRQINKLMNYMNALAGGVRKAAMKVAVAAVKASGTITFSGTGAASDTVLINGVTFTAVASGATGNQWNVGGSASVSADNLAAAINASATALVSNNVTASAASGVVTISAAKPGTLGNCITIAEGVDSASAMAVSGARLTGGTEGTEKTYLFGGAAS